MRLYCLYRFGLSSYYHRGVGVLEQWLDDVEIPLVELGYSLGDIRESGYRELLMSIKVLNRHGSS